MSGENLSIKPDGRRVCLACHREGERRRQRALGVRPAKRLTPDEKLQQRRKWEATRRARQLDAFVEDVDPAVVFQRSAGVCGICDKPVSLARFEVDHIVPLARGGEHSYANTQASHPGCNRRKWALPV